MTPTEAARLIDISAVRTQHTRSDIEEVVAYAKKYRFINVHTLPNWTKELAEMLADTPDVYVGAPVGFPSGGQKSALKVAEARALVADGVQEMDIVMNVGRFRSGEYDYVLNELIEIIEGTPSHIQTKVIIELNTLNDKEMKKACEIAIAAQADYVKTGTGWVPGDANIERIRSMKEICGSKTKIKAAGGIRTPQEFLTLCEIGVERFGINTKSAIEIVEFFKG